VKSSDTGRVPPRNDEGPRKRTSEDLMSSPTLRYWLVNQANHVRRARPRGMYFQASCDGVRSAPSKTVIGVPVEKPGKDDRAVMHCVSAVQRRGR
jgi:hypothetical protein